LLLVEDDLFARESLLSLLEEEAMRVEVAENGLQALDAIRTGSYDLVLMDLQMPVMGGAGGRPSNYRTTRHGEASDYCNERKCRHCGGPGRGPGSRHGRFSAQTG
jgi:hypothetical protein